MSIAVVFPGQGSQSVGMLADMATVHPVIGETFAEAADVLGTDLWALSQAGPEQALADSRVTQPLVFTADIALWRVLVGNGLPTPAAFAGHSLGEFAALVASGALGFEHGLRLVQRRAALMATAVPEGEGGMAAVLGLDDDEVIAVCVDATDEAAHRICEAVNFNAPGQVVISGHLDALERACALARERGAKRALMLPVSVPNHTSLMQAAGAGLAELIDALQWTMPVAPLVQNAGASAPASLEAMLASLRKHVFNPVRWTASVTDLRDAHGVGTLIECGPGKVLSGLVKRIDRGLICRPTDSPAALEAALEAAAEASASTDATTSTDRTGSRA